MASGVRITDGQWSFDGGVNSAVVPVLRSELIPTGLKRNQLAWLNNGTVRGGGITPRTGWDKLLSAADGTTWFQGGYLYDNSYHGTNPYLVLVVGGHVLRCLVEPPYTVTDLSVVFGLYHPAAIEKCFFVQAEEFLVIQAGDYDTPGAINPPVTDAFGRTLPLIWDGVLLRRSLGIISPNNVPGVYAGLPYNELPAATCMCYYMDRIWYAQKRTFAAGDILKDTASGTAPYEYRDSVLKVTECPLAFGGDNFTVGASDGDIRAMDYAATQDTVLGQGPLFVFTRKNVWKFTVPVTRDDWSSVTSANKPSLTLAQDKMGTYSERSIVKMSGDLFYASPDGYRSLMQAIRYFNQWGNTPISNNEQRAIAFNDRSLMKFASGIEFDNRIWETALPERKSAGVVSKAILPLDFDLVSTLEEKLPPAWEGMYQGLDILQMWSGDFGGLQRAFCAVISKNTGYIDVWEFSLAHRFENGVADNRVTMYVEFPAHAWHGAFRGSAGEIELKDLDGGEIYVDKLFGTVEWDVYYRVDSDPCWREWTHLSFCAARSCAEDVDNPVCYPEEPYREGFRFPITLPKPPEPPCETMNKRPTTRGYFFQVKLVQKGWSRIRGMILFAIPVMKPPFGEGAIC